MSEAGPHAGGRAAHVPRPCPGWTPCDDYLNHSNTFFSQQLRHFNIKIL